MIDRIQELNTLRSLLRRRPVVAIIGARQVGKTTLAQRLLTSAQEQGRSTLTLNCDNPSDRQSLENKDLEFLIKLIGNAAVVFIDEGQKIKVIGIEMAHLIVKEIK